MSIGVHAPFLGLAPILCVVMLPQVLRALLTIMEEFGSVPVVQRAPPVQLVAASRRELLKPLATSAVAALKVGLLA